MTGKMIQGSFLTGQPRWSPSVQPKIALSSFQAKTVAPPPTVFAPRPSQSAAPARAAQPTALQRHGASGAFAVEAGALGIASSGGKPLPDTVRGKMETALGADFSGVRVHVGPQAERIGAIAFTTGNDIYFAPGRYQPETTQGQQLLGHELAHVVQQRAGRVRNPLGSGLAVVQDRALEAEADRLGQRAAFIIRDAVQTKLKRGLMQPSVRMSGGNVPLSGTGSNFRSEPQTPNRTRFGRASAVVQRLRWEDLPQAIAVNGSKFNYNGKEQIYWKDGAGKGYDGVHYTLVAARVPKYVASVHCTYNVKHKEQQFSPYSWYTLTGDAPNIVATRQRDPNKNGTATLQMVDKVLLVYKGPLHWDAVKNMTYDQYWNTVVGTYNFDQDVLNFVRGLNDAIRLNSIKTSIKTSKQVTASDKDFLISNQEGKEELFKTMKNKGVAMNFALTADFWDALGVGAAGRPRDVSDDTLKIKQQAMLAGIEQSKKEKWGIKKTQ